MAQRLPLRLEASDDLHRIHARLDDFEGYLATNGLILLGHIDDAHTALADLLQQLVRADARAGIFRRENLVGGRPNGIWCVQYTLRRLVRPQEGLDFGAKCRVAFAGPVEIGSALVAACHLDGLEKDRFL
jgi:hypothetical protein